jgi:hypothetical protein
VLDYRLIRQRKQYFSRQSFGGTARLDYSYHSGVHCLIQLTAAEFRNSAFLPIVNPRLIHCQTKKLLSPSPSQ